MYIFVDEAGGFQITKLPHQISCVSALVVPESLVVTLFRRFRRLRARWSPEEPEIKGSRLNEQQMAEVIGLVRRFDVLLIGVAIDMGMHTESGITTHKELQATNLRRAAATAKSARWREQLRDLASRFVALPNQLYVQSVLTTRLLKAVLQAGSLYYAQRIPKTLGSFSWRLDAKDHFVTNYERLWREVVSTFLQSEALKAPLLQMVEADYSAFSKFCGENLQAPPHLRDHVSDPAEKFHYLDIEAILADLKFCRSHTSTGVQLVDILGAAIRRSCNGTLKRHGWRGLGRLMPTAQRNQNAVRFLCLEDIDLAKAPYAPIVKEWGRETRKLIV